MFISFGFCFICSLGPGFLFFPFVGMPSDIKNLYNLIIRSHLNSIQVDLNHKYGEVLHTYEVFVLMFWPTYQSNSSLFLMFVCWRMSSVCDWQLVPWDCRGGKSCGTFHSGQILNLLCFWISQLCILVNPLDNQLVVSDNDVFTILCILCRHSYMFLLAYLTDNHCVLWYVSEKRTTWWWKNWNHADWSCHNKEVWVVLGINHYFAKKVKMHYSLEVSTLPTFSETATCWLFNYAVISTDKTTLQYFDKVFVTYFSIVSTLITLSKLSAVLIRGTQSGWWCLWVFSAIEIIDMNASRGLQRWSLDWLQFLCKTLQLFNGIDSWKKGGEYWPSRSQQGMCVQVGSESGWWGSPIQVFFLNGGAIWTIWLCALPFWGVWWLVGQDNGIGGSQQSQIVQVTEVCTRL